MDTAGLINLAEAFYEEARARDQLGELLGQLSQVATTTSQLAEFSQILNFPGLPAAERAGMLLPALAGQPDPLVKRFLVMLAERRRLGDLPEIVRLVEELSVERAGRQFVRLETAAPLTPEHRQRLVQALEKLLKAELELREQVAPELIGGMRLQVGSEIIDESVSGRLDRIKAHLMDAS